MDPGGQPSRSAAQRRRERRFRFMLRHERMTVAMALAEKLHHSSRGQKMARAGEEESELHYTDKDRKTPPPQPVLFKLFEEEPGGGSQERVLLHTVEHADDICPFVQILDPPVVNFFRFLDTQLPVEQVTDVPKISEDIVQPRMIDCDLRHPQITEQLVEVPTVLSFASLQQQTLEHIVNIPVPRGRGGSGSFSQDRVILCLPSRSLTIQFRMLLVIMEVFKVFSKDRIQQRLSSRALTFQFLVVPFTIFNLILGRQPHPQYLVMRLFQGFFSHFSLTEKVRRSPARWVKTCPGTSAHPRQGF